MTIRISRYFGLPPELIERGVVPKMSESDLRLCTFAYWKSDNRSSREFLASDSEISQKVGVSTRSLSKARRSLSELGILQCFKGVDNRYTYILCDLNTGKPFPGNPREKAPYTRVVKTVEKPVGTAGPQAVVLNGIPNQKAEFSDEASDIVRTRNQPREAKDGTDFPFGWNQVETKRFFHEDQFAK
jgi:hypothetical protein